MLGESKTIVETLVKFPLTTDDVPNGVTVKVLPISEVLKANDPGRSLPFVILTLPEFKASDTDTPSELVSLRVELAPVSSVKK